MPPTLTADVLPGMGWHGWHVSLFTGQWRSTGGCRSCHENSGRTEKRARRGFRASRPTRPAEPMLHLAELGRTSPTRDDSLDVALGTLRRTVLIGIWPADSGKIDARICSKVLAKRKPALLLRWFGCLSLWEEQRQLSALLFHNPPRKARLDGHRPMPSTLVAVAAQAARSSAENARDSPEGLRPTAKIVAVCAKVDCIGPSPTARRGSGRLWTGQFWQSLKHHLRNGVYDSRAAIGGEKG